MYGECRCCRVKGNHQDMTKEYYYNGIREMYVDIFMECFNLGLSTNSQLTMLICSPCVLRLRDASYFRIMVMNNENRLIDALTRTDNKHTVFINVPNSNTTIELESEVNIEEIKEEPTDLFETENAVTLGEEGEKALLLRCPEESLKPLVSNQEHLFMMCHDYAKKFESPKDAKTHAVDGEKALWSRFTEDSQKPLPTKQQLPTVCPNNAKKITRRGRIVKPLELEKLHMNGENNLEVSEKIGQIINTNTILQFSNAVPFKSRPWAGFTCFYCPTKLDNLSLLRDHSVKHDKSELIRLLKTYSPYRLVVNMDVTDLACSVCDLAATDVNTLKTHLIEVHQKEYHKEYTDRLIPFKSIDDFYECQVCGEDFVLFGTVERHMNTHYNNFLCNECGMGFVTENRLKVHLQQKHGDGTYPCEQCNGIFKTKSKLKMHVEIRHNMLKRFKCLKCNERFTEYFHRQKHMTEAHGVEPVKFKCSECDRTFRRRYGLDRHMKRNHLEEKDHHCSQCSYKCFTKNELRLHIIKHTGKKEFKCTVCNKALSRKKSLTEHMKIHTKDRRLMCSVCGHTFVQMAGLKGHMKTQHNNMEHKVN